MMANLAAAAHVVAGVFTMIFWWIHPRPELFERAEEGGWLVSNLLFIALVISLQLGLAGLMMTIRNSPLLLVPAFFANGCFVGLGVVDGFVMVALVRSGQRALLAPDGPLFGGPLMAMFMTTGLVFLAGYWLAAFALWKSRQRIPSILLLLSAPVLGLSPVMPHAARFIGCFLFGAACLLLARDLRRSARAEG